MSARGLIQVVIGLGAFGVGAAFTWLYTRRSGRTISKEILAQNDIETDSTGQDDVETDEGPMTRYEQPPAYSEGKYDAVVLCASKVEEKAKRCIEELRQHAKIDGECPLIGVVDDIILPGTYTIEGLSDLLIKCRLVIIFHTQYFKSDGLADYGKHINLRQAVEDTDKKARVIPMIADETELSNDLRALLPIEYSDQDFHVKMQRLLAFWRQKLP